MLLLHVFFKQLKISVYVQSTQPLFKKLLSFVHCFSNILKAIKEFIITMSCKWPVLLSLLTICIFFSNFTHGYEGADSNFHSPPLSGMSFFFIIMISRVWSRLSFHTRSSQHYFHSFCFVLTLLYYFVVVFVLE